MKLHSQDQERAEVQADKDLILAMPDREGELDPDILNQVLSRLAHERRLAVEAARLRSYVESLTKLVNDKNMILNKIRAGRYRTKTKISRAIAYHFSREKSFSFDNITNIGEPRHARRNK